MINPIELSIIAPALLVGVLVILTHVPLGIEVFKRGIIFIDVAVAQTAALGMIIAHQIFPNIDHGHNFIEQIFAFLAAILVGIILTFTDKKFPKFQEAIIGSTFILAASLSIIILSKNAHGAEDFQNILAGQILWSSFKDVIWLAIFYAPILAIWFLCKNKIGNVGFYLLFALTITASVQIIGIYLVFSFLILPAFVGINFKNYQKQIFFSYLIAAIGLGLGIALSSFYDYPTGPTISVALMLSVILMNCLLKGDNYSKFSIKRLFESK